MAYVYIVYIIYMLSTYIYVFQSSYTNEVK